MGTAFDCLHRMFATPSTHQEYVMEKKEQKKEEERRAREAARLKLLQVWCGRGL